MMQAEDKFAMACKRKPEKEDPPQEEIKAEPEEEIPFPTAPWKKQRKRSRIVKIDG